MNQIHYSFLDIPIELQTEIANYLTTSDLKSLCLVSKHIFDIITLLLYHEINLIKEKKIYSTKERSTKERIHILPDKPANLHFVQVLKMPWMTSEDSLLMDQLLPLFRKHFLREIEFYPTDIEKFPMPHQMEFLWYNQKNLKNLTFKSHMAPWLDEFSKKLQSNQRNILKFFTILEISAGLSSAYFESIQNNQLWPLENLDISVLQNLRLI